MVQNIISKRRASMNQQEIIEKAVKMREEGIPISKIYFFAKKEGLNREDLFDLKAGSGKFFKVY